MKPLLCLVLLSVLLYSCKSALDRVYNEETLVSDARAIIDDDELQEEEIMQLGRYIQQLRIERKPSNDKSYRDLYHESTKWTWYSDSEYTGGGEKNMIIENVVPATTDLIGFQMTTDRRYVRMYLDAVNQGKKEIRSLEGTLEFPALKIDDMNGMVLEFPSGLKPDEEASGVITIPGDPFGSTDWIGHERRQNPKFRWRTKKVVFADGSVLE